ncbi:MAG: class III cytochrome C family protein [Magnetococcales bacterium]|nr:class III cytochrome C family protein [Magnetococcales bacterium]
MKRTATVLFWISLLCIAGLVVLRPHWMISPGSLIQGHRALESDCLGCHDPMFGASSDKCVSCHKVETIGVMTTKGVAIASAKNKARFHQKLLGRDCLACHSDHAGVAPFRTIGRFSHQLLEERDRHVCSSCHARPGDSLHLRVSESCHSCHGLEKWKPAVFKHEWLPVAQREQCVACHKDKTPVDSLHRQTLGRCGQCHSVERWKPATFDHRRSFVLDKDHDAKCMVCHPKDDYNRYTCYGCHEHSVRKIRDEHLEEGIRDFERCVLCHRDADEHKAEWLWKSGRWRDGLSGSVRSPVAGDPHREPSAHRFRPESHKKDDD